MRMGIYLVLALNFHESQLCACIKQIAGLQSQPRPFLEAEKQLGRLSVRLNEKVKTR